MQTLNMPIMQMPKTWVPFLLNSPSIYRIFRRGWGKNLGFTFNWWIEVKLKMSHKRQEEEPKSLDLRLNVDFSQLFII